MNIDFWYILAAADMNVCHAAPHKQQTLSRIFSLCSNVEQLKKKWRTLFGNTIPSAILLHLIFRHENNLEMSDYLANVHYMLLSYKANSTAFKTQIKQCAAMLVPLKNVAFECKCDTYTNTFKSIFTKFPHLTVNVIAAHNIQIYCSKPLDLPNVVVQTDEIATSLPQVYLAVTSQLQLIILDRKNGWCSVESGFHPDFKPLWIIRVHPFQNTFLVGNSTMAFKIQLSEDLQSTYNEPVVLPLYPDCSNVQIIDFTWIMWLDSAQKCIKWDYLTSHASCPTKFESHVQYNSNLLLQFHANQILKNESIIFSLPADQTITAIFSNHPYIDVFTMYRDWWRCDIMSNKACILGVENVIISVAPLIKW